MGLELIQSEIDEERVLGTFSLNDHIDMDIKNEHIAW